MNGKALGLLETYGYIGAIEAADACLKAANVELIGLELVRGGLVTLKIGGNVSAVKASIDAGATAADRVGTVVSIDVIARMGEGLEKIVFNPKKNEEIEQDVKKEIVEAKTDDRQEEKDDFLESKDLNRRDETHSFEGREIDTSDLEKSKVKAKDIIKYNGKLIRISDPNELINIKVVDLRRIARGIDGISIEKGLIKFAKKNELIEALTSYFNREVE
ncbi:BMC domain-containing protein [Wukongibacter baidiensis]|uniref:BMC domain-containing protein n=1 Tax=Wukongibacter baidiensis TaxID=1723361 RepID=UPI003D7F3039